MKLEYKTRRTRMHHSKHSRQSAFSRTTIPYLVKTYFHVSSFQITVRSQLAQVAACYNSQTLKTSFTVPHNFNRNFCFIPIQLQIKASNFQDFSDLQSLFETEHFSPKFQHPPRTPEIINFASFNLVSCSNSATSFI